MLMRVNGTGSALVRKRFMGPFALCVWVERCIKVSLENWVKLPVTQGDVDVDGIRTPCFGDCDVCTRTAAERQKSIECKREVS